MRFPHLHPYNLQHSPSWEANQCAASQHLPAYRVTRRLIATFTSARHLFLPSANSKQSIPLNLTYWKSALILFSNLRLGLSIGLFPPGFHNKALYTPPPISAKCLTDHILNFAITRTILGEKYRTLSSSLCSFLHCPLTSSLLSPKSVFRKRANFLKGMRGLSDCHLLHCSHETSMRQNSKDRRWADVMYLTGVTWEYRSFQKRNVILEYVRPERKR
jgi:hypothetical protein